MGTNNIYGIKDSANFTVKYKAGTNKGKVFVYADYATVSTNEWNSEQVYAKSKNVNAIRWDYGRNSTLKIDMEIFDLKWIGMYFGTDFITDTNGKEILKREALTVASGKATLVGTPVTGSVSVYKLADDGLTNEKELVSGSTTPKTGEYVLSNKEISVFASDFEAGEKIVVYYLEKKTDTRTLVINADKYPENFEIFADTMIRKTDGEDEFVQIHYFNVKPKSQFTLTMDAGNITTLSAEFDVLKDTGSSDMAEYTIYK
jgi:hypothetical protein